MYSKYKLITEDEKKGVWIKEGDLLDTIKILKNRNQKLYNLFVSHWEYLEDRKFDLELIK